MRESHTMRSEAFRRQVEAKGTHEMRVVLRGPAGVLGPALAEFARLGIRMEVHGDGKKQNRG